MKSFIKQLYFNFYMGEIDYVIPSVNVDWEGKLDLREIYSFCKKWLLERKYDLSENEYDNDETEKGNNIRIKWWAFKKIDDYTRFNIDVIALFSLIIMIFVLPQVIFPFKQPFLAE